MSTNSGPKFYCLNSFQQHLSEESSYVAAERRICKKVKALNKDNLAVPDHFQFPFPTVDADKAN